VRRVITYCGLFLAALIVFGGMNASAAQHIAFGDISGVEHHYHGAPESTNMDHSGNVLHGHNCGPNLSCSVYLLSVSDLMLPTPSQGSVVTAPSLPPAEAFLAGPYRPPTHTIYRY